MDHGSAPLSNGSNSENPLKEPQYLDSCLRGAYTSSGSIEYEETSIIKPQYFCLGDHPIINKWSESLKNSLCSALGGLKWRRFYPAKVLLLLKDNLSDPKIAGDSLYERIPRLTLVVDLPRSECVRREEATNAVSRCLEILRSAGILDFEVEIRRITECHYASSGELKSLIRREEEMFVAPLVQGLPESAHSVAMEYLQLFMPNVGYRILHNAKANLEVPGYAKAIYSSAGTIGLHVRLSGDDENIYGLTCGHVFCPAGEDSAPGVSLASTSGEYRDPIVQFTQVDLEHDRWHLNGKVYLASRNRRASDFSRRIEQINAQLDQIQEMDPTSRIIGHLACMPPFDDNNISPMDWALVRLNEDMFDEPPTNEIWCNNPCGHSSRRQFEGSHIKEVSFRWPRRGLLRLKGTLHPEETRGRSIPVFKTGGASKLTTSGVTNEISAVARLENGTITEEWIILAVIDLFALQGDSGAMVFDIEGRILGMISKGLREQMQVIFVRPLTDVIKDIESHTSQRVEIL